MTFYQRDIPANVEKEFNFVAQHLTGKSLREVGTVLDERPWNYPYTSLPRGYAVQFDAPNVGLTVLLTASTSWDSEGWVDVLYLRPIGYDGTPFVFGSGAIGDVAWLDKCVAHATELYQRPDYRKSWLKHTRYAE